MAHGDRQNCLCIVFFMGLRKKLKGEIEGSVPISRIVGNTGGLKLQTRHFVEIFNVKGVLALATYR